MKETTPRNQILLKKLDELPTKEYKEITHIILQEAKIKEEPEFLKYLIDCCENILENPTITNIGTIFKPEMMQLMKMRAEVTTRLEKKYNIKYGKFSKGTHLLSSS